MTIIERRKRLRREAIRRRDGIPLVTRAVLSQQIMRHVIDWVETNHIHSVMLYFSMRSEVETEGLFAYLLEHKKTVLAPVTDLEQRTLTPYRVTDLRQDLTRHAYGMLEPNPEICSPFPLEQIELVAVPGVAFDRRGYRIGYGGGLYDRFLPRCSKAVRAGLAYEAQIIDSIFPEAWDVPLHLIFTEQGVVAPEQG